MTSLIENLARIKTTFDDIKNAILSKGVAAGDTVDTYADAIMRIQTGTDVSDTTATEDDVLNGKSFHKANGEYVDGTIPSKTSADLTTSGATVNVPSGYYSENASKTIGNATLGSVSFNADGRATVDCTTDGYLSKGTKVDTTIPAYGGNAKVFATQSEFSIASAGDTKFFKNGLTIGKLSQTNLTAANILKGTTVAVNNGSTDVWKINGSASRCKYGTGTTTSGGSLSVTLGWKPTYVFARCYRSSSYTWMGCYINGSCYNVSTGGSAQSTTALITVSSTGVTISPPSNYYGTINYVAIE